MYEKEGSDKLAGRKIPGRLVSIQETG